MELRRLSICLAFFVLAVVSQCSEARHSLHRRASDFSEEFQNDGTADYVGDDNEVNEDEEDTPAIITSKSESFTVRVGSRVRLECQITPPNAVPALQWIKGEDVGLFLNRIPQSEQRNKYELDNSGYNLIINDVNVNDTDSYTCKILQQEQPASVTHKVFVNVPPMIESFTVSDNEPVEGTAVVFTCKTSGVPKPSVMWSRLRNGEKSTETLAEANGEFHNQTFYMPNVTSKDSGLYYCYAVNDAGNATAQTVKLNVLSKPHVHAHMAVVNSDIGVEAVLKCSTRDGPHVISWYKDGRHINTGGNFVVNQAERTSESTLTVIPKTNEDFGTFTCEASNRVGPHSKSIKLTNLPVIEDVDFEGRKLTFTVHSHQPLVKIEAFLRGEFQDDMTRLEVPVPETAVKHMREVIYVFDEDFHGKYELKLRAENTNGWGDVTDPIYVNSDLEAQPQKIETASVLGTGSGAYSVLCSPSIFLNTVMMYLLVRTL